MINEKQLSSLNVLGYDFLGMDESKRSYVFVIDKNGYRHSMNIYSLLKGSIPDIVHVSNPFAIENMIKWIEDNEKTFYLNDNSNYIGTQSKLVFHCYVCDNDFNATWDAVSQGTGCGVCNGKQVTEKTCFAYFYPDLVCEWLDSNIYSPFEVTAFSNKDILWCCKNCNHIWKAKVSTRTSLMCGCPACAGLIPTEVDNLFVEFPEKLDEWDYELNGSPLDYRPFSQKRVSWICRDCGNKWKTSVANRTTGDKSNCPYCAHKIPTNDNNFEYLFPELLPEWNNDKNGDPSKFLPHTNKKVWWNCLRCGNEWFGSINGRTRNDKCKRTGCPICSLSLGESVIYDFLKLNNIKFETQTWFDDCPRYGTHPLRFDFYIEGFGLIEYQGPQHYFPVDFAGRGMEWAEDQLEIGKIKDQIKRDYCENENIYLLEIPYTEFNNIESILTYELGL